jgi:hypothetical protein
LAYLLFFASQIPDAVKNIKSIFGDSYLQTIQYGINQIYYFLNKKFFDRNKEIQSFDGAKGEYHIVDWNQVPLFFVRHF